MLAIVGALSATAALALGTMWLIDSGRSQIVRLLALVADLAVVAVGVALLREQHPGGPQQLAYFVLSALFLGATLHLIGVIAWDGDFPWAARALGSILVAIAVAVPGIHSLLLPVVPVLALTLRSPAASPTLDHG